VKQLDNCYLRLQNTENPDVASQRAGSEDHIDLFFTKPNKHGLCEKATVLTGFKTRLNNNDSTISQSGTKAARALHLLVSSHKKVARKHQTPSI
jgi:hypothetical protein